MYLVVTDKQIYKAEKLAKLNSKYGFKFVDEDFTSISEDKIMMLSKDSYEYVKDLHRMSLIPIEKLFKPDTSSKLLLYIIILMSFINMVR